MIKTADRLLSVEEYYFSKKLREVNSLLNNGKPIINLGIGSPDINPPKQVIDAIANSLNDANAHKYQSYQGLPELRKAISKFYLKHFDVSLNFQTEILPLMGSKEGIFHISMAFLNKGDSVLIPNPGYPTYTSVTKLVEAKPIYYSLDEKNGWLPNLDQLEKLDLSNVKLMWVNYPHMPTGTLASKSFFESLIGFAKAHDILIINDNPYSFILNKNPLSILNIKNAYDNCIELNSLSKTFNMAGWRVGMVLGKKSFIDAVLKVKSNMDSGMFYGIQKGAIKALNCSDSWFKNLNNEYIERRQLIWELAKNLDCTFSKNTAGMFVWAKLKTKINAEAFVDKLLHKHHIFIAPGSIFGNNCDGYVRFSLCAPKKQIIEALNRIKNN